MPTHCPLCGVEVVKPEGEAMHRCPNRACPSRGLETLINWVMAAADIDGVGEQSVRRLWELGLVRSLPELYRLTKEQLLELDGFGEISADNAIEAIEASKAIPFSRVLFGLNIPDVGWVTAQTLARHFGDVDALMNATQEELVEAEGIGPERAEAIAEWFRDEDNRSARRGAARARAALRDRRGGSSPVEGPLTGQHVRDHRHARALHARRGRRARSRRSARRSANSVSSKTTGADRRRGAGQVEADEGARRPDVPLLDEADLLELLGGG